MIENIAEGMSAVGRKRISKWDLETPKSPEKPVDNFSTDKEQILEPQMKLRDLNSEGVPLHNNKEPIQEANTGWDALTLQSKNNVNDIFVQTRDSEWEEPVPQYKEVEEKTSYTTHINEETRTEIQGVGLVGKPSNDEEHTHGKIESEINVFGSEPLLESSSEFHGGGRGMGVLGKRPFHDEESILEYVPNNKTESGAGCWDGLLPEEELTPEAPPTEVKGWGCEAKPLGVENVIKVADEVNVSGWEAKSYHSDITGWSSDEKCLGKRNGDFCANPPGFLEKTTIVDEGSNNDSGWTSRCGSGGDSPKWEFKKDSASDSWERKSKWEVPKNQSNYEGFSERNEILPRTDSGSRFSSSPPAANYPLKRAKPTDICYDFVKGNCNKGDTCHFSHHGSDFNVPSPHGPNTQQLPLPLPLLPPAHIDPGKWYPGSSQHPPPDRNSRRLIPFPCKFYAYGNCRNGENCRFSHTGEVSHIGNGPPANTMGPSGWSNKPSSTGSGSVVPVAVSGIEIAPQEVKPSSSRSRWDKDSNDTRGGLQLPKMNKPEASFPQSKLVNSFTQYPPHPLNQPFRPPHFQQNSFRPSGGFPVGGIPGFPVQAHLHPIVNAPGQKPVSSEELARITNISASLAQLLGSGQQLPQLYASLHPVTGNEIRPTPVPSSIPASISTSAPIPTPVITPIPTPALGLIHSTVPNRPPITSDTVSSQNPSEFVRPPVTDSASVNPSISATVSDSTKRPVTPVPEPSVALGQTEGSAEAQVKQVRKSGVGGEINGTGGKEGRKEKDNVEGSGKGEEGKKGKDGKVMRAFKFSLVECIKDILKPTWKDGQIDKEGYKMVVKKVAEKVISTLEENVPQSQDKVDQYLTFSKSKLTKLVQAYVEKQQQQQQQ